MFSQPAVSESENDDSLNDSSMCWTATFSPSESQHSYSLHARTTTLNFSRASATGRDPVRERLLENEKSNFKLVAEKVSLDGTCTVGTLDTIEILLT